MKRIVIFGGNGFVGQNIAKSLLDKYANSIKIISVNRSSAPTSGPLVWSLHKSQVTWHRSDVFNPSSYAEILSGADCVISCIGAFGSNEFMEKINGDANVLAVSESYKAGEIINIQVSVNIK